MCAVCVFVRAVGRLELEGFRVVSELPLTKHYAIRFSFLRAKLVGLSRFELLTPRLSSVCSNQLSYRPRRIVDWAIGECVMEIPIPQSPIPQSSMSKNRMAGSLKTR